MPNKMKIRVHESEETLLDSFELLDNEVGVISRQLTARSNKYSIWADMLKIQKGEVPEDSPKDLKVMFERMKEKIDRAFDNVIGKLDSYL